MTLLPNIQISLFVFPVKPWEASLSPHRPFQSYTAVGFMKELLFFLIEIASLANPSTFPPMHTPSIILKGEFLGVPSASNCEERLEMQKDEAPKTDRDRGAWEAVMAPRHA